MPKPEQIAELPAPFRWGGPGPVTDYIDMDFVLREIDPGLRFQVIATRFENVAALHRTLAEGASKLAAIFGGARSK